MLDKLRKTVSAACEAFVRSALIVCGLLVCFASGELWLNPASAEGLPVFCAIGVVGGVLIFILQWQMFRYRSRSREKNRLLHSMRAEIRGYAAQVKALEHRRQCLARRVEELTAQSLLDSAAATSDSFDDFMNTIARLARDNNGARELTVFTCDNEAPLPLAAYQLSDAIELCLSFSSAGATVLAADIAEHGRAISSRFSASAMNINEFGRQLIINGELQYCDAPAGRMRLAVLNSDPQNRPDRPTLRKLVASCLSLMVLDNGGIRQALRSDAPVAAPGVQGQIRLATALRTGEDILGAIRMGFAPEVNDNLYEQQRSLSATASRVAKALKHEKIYEQAIKDGLTGLFNKRHMLANFEHQMQLALRHGKGLCLILVDIDHFKKVNDTWGHLTGDIVLREVSAILLGNVRGCDMPCRYGGEELAVILPEEDLRGAGKLAERLRQCIARKEFISDKGKPLKVTASFGVAACTPDMQRVEDLISEADQALYEAKKSGRNQVVLARGQRAALG